MLAAQCFDFLSEVPNSVNGEAVESKKYYSWTSKEKGWYSVHAVLHNRVLGFEITMKDLETDQRSRFRGRDVFRLMVDHFGVENIDYVKARWVEGSNYDEFVSNLKRMGKKKAAQNTWTGRRAAEYGFTRVKNVKILTGIDYIEVYFTKPRHHLRGRFNRLKSLYNLEYWDD